ncbi:DUF1801 domain-containing protein [bacterium]|nr:DUF1801 domain-containing protein [bacterium]
MKKSANEQVQNFLESILTFDDEKYNILQNLRKIVFRNHPNTDERIMYGRIMFSLNEVNGIKMKDPKKHLEGTGKDHRHLKIRSLADIKDKEVDFFVKQTV